MQAQTPATTLIRGGQTTHHWYRMALQVARFATVVGCFVYILSVLFLSVKDYSPDLMRIAIYYELAERGVLEDNGFNKAYTFKDLDGTTVTMEAVDLYRDNVLRQVRDSFFSSIHYAAYFSIIPAVFAGCIALLIFMRTGDRIQQDEFVRGARLVEARHLKRWSADQWKKYRKTHKGRKLSEPLTIAEIAFPPNAVEAQTGLYGTVGVGKTNAMTEMLSTIRKNGGKAVIYDRMGSFVSKFYNPETDILINPFDGRSHCWNLFADVTDAASFTQIAEVMIPEHRGSGDVFWSQAARVVFEYACRQLYERGNPKVSDLYDYVLKLPVDKLSELIQSTPGQHFFNEGIEKTAQSIRANLIAELRFLEFLREDGEEFSARDWMRSDEPSFLFLTGDAEHAKATCNIISSIFEISANALMVRGPASEPRCYFFIDELPTLNRLPFLVSSLAEIRQFGGAFVLGFQVFSQLQDIYGKEAAQSISGVVNNRIIFSTPDFQTAKLCSDSLGSSDTFEKNTMISVGAHEARDGVGFQQNRMERPIVTASEIQVLPQFQAYVKFAYGAPAALIQFPIAHSRQVAEAFQPYMGDASGFSMYKIPEPEKPKVDPEAEQKFRHWVSTKFSQAEEDWVKSGGPIPYHFEAYREHVTRQILAGVPNSEIDGIILETPDLMRQASCEADDAVTCEHTGENSVPSDVSDDPPVNRTQDDPAPCVEAAKPDAPSVEQNLRDEPKSVKFEQTELDLGFPRTAISKIEGA